jgi:spore coat protein U-like protein
MSSPVYGSTFTGTTPSCASQTTLLGTFTFSVTATVVSSCTVTATTLNFGTTSFFTANIDGTSTVSVTCTSSTPYHVRLDGGLAAATDPTQRKMTLGANTVTYGLYRDSARSLPWGNTDGSNTVDATGTASAIGHTVYGRIAPQASQPPGTYTDTVVTVVSF